MRRAAQLTVVALVATAALVLPSAGWARAAAATCAGADGVSVVVDFHELGGGVRTACVADGGGRTASALFASAGFELAYVQRQPGFVCRVSGLPADDPCVATPPADAYWGLYWSDGTTGVWSYASLGAGSQTVPDGGSVAFSWTGRSGRVQPGAAPAVHATAATPSPTAKPAPTKRPTEKPTEKPSERPSEQPTGEPTSGATATLSATQSQQPTQQPTGKPSERPTATTDPGQPTKSPGGVDGEMLPEDQPSPAAAEPAEPDDDGLPTWVGPAVVVVLFAAGATVAVVRRRRTG